MTLPKSPLEVAGAVHGPRATPSTLSLLVGTVLLVLATVHCVVSIFVVNHSYLDLRAYASGMERMPYQGRIGMMPVLQFAENSPKIVAFTASLNRMLAYHARSTLPDFTPESLASMISAILAMLISVTVAAAYGLKRFTAAWWLPPSLLLTMLYVTQDARYETALWYPYDLPHAALFGSACLMILEGLWLPVLLLFLIDVPVRETSIFLVAVTVAVSWARSDLKRGLTVSGLMLAAWIPFRLYVGHRFKANPSEFGTHIYSQFRLIQVPVQWPQTMSLFGFMLLPLCLGHRLLSRPQRAFLLGALPCFVVTLGFGVWPETRIFGEWLMPAAVLLTAELMQKFPPRSGGLDAV